MKRNEKEKICTRSEREVFTFGPDFFHFRFFSFLHAICERLVAIVPDDATGDVPFLRPTFRVVLWIFGSREAMGS